METRTRPTIVTVNEWKSARKVYLYLYIYIHVGTSMRVYNKKNYDLAETRCEWRWRDDTQLSTPPSSATKTSVCGCRRFKTRDLPNYYRLFSPAFPREKRVLTICAKSMIRNRCDVHMDAIVIVGHYVRSLFLIGPNHDPITDANADDIVS